MSPRGLDPGTPAEGGGPKPHNVIPCIQASACAQCARQHQRVVQAFCARWGASQARPAVCSRRSCGANRRTAGRRPGAGVLRKPGRRCAALLRWQQAHGRPAAAHSFGLRYKQGGRAEKATAPLHRRPPAKSSESGRRRAGGGPLARGVDSLWQRRRSRRMREASGCAWMRRLAVPPSGRYSGVGSLGRGAGVLRIKFASQAGGVQPGLLRRTAGRRPQLRPALQAGRSGRAGHGTAAPPAGQPKALSPAGAARGAASLRGELAAYGSVGA